MQRWEKIQFKYLYKEPSRNGLMRPKAVRGKGYKMINMGELFAHHRIKNPSMDLVPMNEMEKQKYAVDRGDLLFARQSLVAEGAGKCSIVLEAPEITTFESHLIRVRLDQIKACPLFYYYYFSSPSGKSDTQSLVMQVAAAGIRASELAELYVPYPPLPTQHKIVAILSAYDDLIENNTRRIAILEEMAQAIYQEWFVNFRYPGHEKDQLVKSDLGMIPEGWVVKKLEQLCAITMGQSPSSQFYNESGSGLPFHQGVTNFGEYFPTNRVYCTIENRIANLGDILFSVRAPVGRINVTLEKIVIGRGLSAIRSKTDTQLFILFQLKNRFQKEDIIGNGSIFQAVTKTDMSNIKLLCPSHNITLLFEEYIRPIFKNIEVLTRKNLKLIETRNCLLPKLILGEIDIEKLDIDIPDIIQLEGPQEAPVVIQPEPIDATQLALTLF